MDDTHHGGTEPRRIIRKNEHLWFRLCAMKRLFLYRVIQIGFVAACLLGARAIGQNQESPGSSTPAVVLTKLFPRFTRPWRTRQTFGAT